MMLKDVERLLEDLLPQSRFKESVRRYYRRYFSKFVRRQYLRYRNPLYALNAIVAKIDRAQDGMVLLELTNGIKLYGPPDRVSGALVVEGVPSRLDRIKEFENYCDLFVVACEQYVDDVYHRMQNLSNGDVVLDLGAHIGAYSVRAASAVGPAGKVIAIEPNSDNFRMLRANVQKNGLENVVLLQKGVWKERGRLNLRLSVTSGSHAFCTDSWDLGNTGESEEIEVDTVDNILRDLRVEKIDFIKMDIEGAELEALQGMSSLLSSVTTNKVSLAIAAYHHRGGIPTYRTIPGRLERLGFRCHLRRGIIYAARRELQVS